MNFRQVVERMDDSFQIAPLIDIVFLLLTFFIVTGALAAEERDMTIDLPQTTTAVVRQQQKLDIVVNVTRDGQIRIPGRAESLSPEDLSNVLTLLQESGGGTPLSVIIRADGRAYHQDVVRVYDACAAAKIRTISIVSVDANESSTR